MSGLRRAGLAVLLAWGLCGSMGRAAAPPGRGLDPARQRRLDKRAALVSRSIAAGRFEQAVGGLQEQLHLRQRWQGPRHWQTVDARFAVQEWRRLTKVPLKDRPAVLRALVASSRGERLHGQGKYRQAEKSFRAALDICKKVLGEEHPSTATCYNNLALCLDDLGQHARALTLYRKALDVSKKVLGQDHPDTAASYNNVASCLNAQAQHAEALPLYQQALAIHKKVLGEQHPQTATSYNNLASCLDDQGQHAKAMPLYQKALDISKKMLGEQHPDTALSYNNVAFCLNAQGLHARALTLYQKALVIRKKVLGQEHPDTAQSYNNVAACLDDQGRHAKALPLYRQALDIRKKVLGPEHPDTAQSYNNSAFCLQSQSQHARALPLFQKALEIRKKVLGQKYPHTAQSYNNVGFCLHLQGQHARALPLLQKALDIYKKVLGEDHPHTAGSSNNVAFCLWRLERIGEAVRLLSASLPGQEAARFHKADSGFTRALAARQASPQVLLALGWARLGKPERAFAHAEASLARALLDDLLSRGDKDASLEELGRRLKHLDGRLLPLLGRAKLSPPEEKRRDALLAEHRALRSRLSRRVAAASARQLLAVADIQKQLPADAALVLWLDVDELGEHRACVLRAKGKPAWLALPGSGKDGAWTAKDKGLPRTLYRLMSDPRAGSDRERRQLSAALHKQRLDPLRPLLAAKHGLPVVRHLLVVPTEWAALVPVEGLSSGYRVSYVPSGSAFALLRRRHRALAGKSLLALGDPAFAIPPRKRAVLSREDGSNQLKALPGTRQEVLTLARRVPGATLLLGSQASEQRLDALAAAGKLKSFRLIHLATHGTVDWEQPERSRLFLARDQLPDPLEQARQNKPVYTGELTVRSILDKEKGWKLDADLVVLSACQTGLGKQRGGDGMLGFAQAFLARGARCVVLSRWQVDDAATALLMLRFYDNLLGKKPLGRAAALEEARSWLRTLSRARALKMAAALKLGKLSSTRVGVGTLPGKVKEVKVPGAERPYDHPYFWASFVLIGDPN